MHGGCTAYTAVGHWNDESEETTREYIWILRVVSESDVFSGLNLIESALFKHGEKMRYVYNSKDISEVQI